MSKLLKDIKAPVAHELKSFEKKFRQAMKSSVPLLDRITHYIVKRKGKQMRPIFVFLSSKLFGEVTDSTYRAASLVELLHTATLVHDDVVDDAHLRRGFFSVNALWKNKIAVLVGDYLLSKGLLLSLENNDFELLRILCNAVKQMSEGELLQIEKARRLNINENVYFEIIRQKTASLISACCACGAVAAGQNGEMINKMHLLGEKVGMAFQIKDDLLDFTEGDTGKPKGIDIQEKKLTLPLIYTLNKASRASRNKIINIVKNHNKDKASIEQVIELIYEHNGVAYAQEKMRVYKNEALEILETLPDNPARKSINALISFTIERTR